MGGEELDLYQPQGVPLLRLLPLPYDIFWKGSVQPGPPCLNGADGACGAVSDIFVFLGSV